MGEQFFVGESQNFAEWQSFVDSCDSASIFQTSYWAKALKEAGTKTLLIVARDRGGDIKGGMLSTYVKFSFLKLSIVPSMTVLGGPLVYDVDDNQLLHDIVKFFDTKAKNLGAFVSSLRSFFPLDKILIRQLNYEFGRLPCTMLFDLNRSIEELWKNMEKNARYGVRKATKAGVVVEEATSFDDLLAYYQIQENTSGRLGIPLISFQVLSTLWQNFFPKGILKLFLARCDTQPIAGVIVFTWQDKIWPYLAASFKQYWRLHPNLMLHWHILKWGKDNGMKMYDFMGIPCSADRNHPLYNLYLFKKQFGGQIVRHGEYVKNQFRLKSNLYHRMLKLTYPVISLMRKEKMAK